MYGGGGYSGDGGAATNAQLYYPEGVAVDASGNLFIADFNNQRVRMVGTNGIISTVAGKGALGFSGDGGAATNAQLIRPEGLVVDASGNLFIADTITTASARWEPTGLSPRWRAMGPVSGYSGDGGGATNAALYHPGGVAVDAFGQPIHRGYQTAASVAWSSEARRWS